MSSAPTHSPTASPTEDLSDLHLIFLMLAGFVLSLFLFCMCFFLSHVKNVAMTHRVQKWNFVKKFEDMLDKNKLKYEPPAV